MTRQEHIRKEILLQLYASRPLALSIERLYRDARKQSYDFTTNEIGREVQFLVDDGLLAELATRGSTATLYRINAAGVRTFEQTFAS